MLPFRRGDVITVIDKTGDAWWYGSMGVSEGYFPKDLVEAVATPPPRAPPAMGGIARRWAPVVT